MPLPTEEIITAERGRLVPSADGKRLLLELENGMIVRDHPDGTVRTVSKFGTGIASTRTSPQSRRRFVRAAMRRAVREAVHELPGSSCRASGVTGVQVDATASRRPENSTAAWRGWCCRCCCPCWRCRWAWRPSVAGAHRERCSQHWPCWRCAQALQFGESLAEAGRAPAWLAVWLPVLIFGVFGRVAVPQQPAMAGRQPRDARRQRHRRRVRRLAAQEEGGREMKRVLGSYLRGRIAGQILGLLLALTGLMQLLEMLEVTATSAGTQVGRRKDCCTTPCCAFLAKCCSCCRLPACWARMSAFYAMARTREITALRTAGVGLTPSAGVPAAGADPVRAAAVRAVAVLVPPAESSLRSLVGVHHSAGEQAGGSALGVEPATASCCSSAAVRTASKLLDVRIYDRDQQGLLTLRTRASERRMGWQSQWQLG